VETYKQLSIFLENEPGTLRRVLEVFSAHAINVVANSVDNLTDCAVYRCVVSDPVKAAHLLGEAGTFVLETDVLGVTVDDTPGSLAAVAGKLAGAGVNIDYAYGSAGGGSGKKALLVLKPSDLEKAQAVLS